MIRLIKKLFRFQFIRFLFIGGINTLFGYGIFALFIFLGLEHQYALLISTIMGVAFNYKTIGFFVFRHKGNSLITAFKFIFVYTISYLLNTYGVGFMLNFIKNTYISGLVIIIPVSVITYFLNKILVFRKTDYKEK